MPLRTTSHTATGVRDRAGAAVVRLDHALLLFWLLSVACVLEFIGPGAFGIITKASPCLTNEPF